MKLNELNGTPVEGEAEEAKEMEMVVVVAEGGRGNSSRRPIKWSPPTATETDGTRMIEVKGQLHKHKYNPTTKRWDRISKPTANPSVTTTTPQTTNTNTTPTTQDDATRRAALANMQQQLTQMNQTFTAFLRKG